jgi:hypothetical protein
MRLCRYQEKRLVLRELAKLAAGSEDVTAFALSNKDMKARLPQYALKSKDRGIIGTAEIIAGKFIERNQIDLATNAVEQLHQPLGILFGIINTPQQDVFECQPPVRCEGILSACRQETIEGVEPIDSRHQKVTLCIRRRIQ